jgi:regulator of protease activity HflC (stomatin/prohibitin superfamily)
MSKLFGWVLGLIKRPKVAVALIVLIFCYSSMQSCFVYVHPDEVGIRQVLFGSDAGIKKEPVHTGLRLAVKGTERIHIFPTDLQVMDMVSSSSSEGGRQAARRRQDGRPTEVHQAGAIRIQTSEGYAVTVEASVLYRIVDPYLVMTQIGPGQLYEHSVVAPRSEQILRRTLGELNAEEFYDPKKRSAKVADAIRELTAVFKPRGIELVKILVRQVTYDAAYQQQIEKRKIQDQAVFKNQAEAKAAKSEAHKSAVVAAGQAAAKVELEKGKNDAARLLADAHLYARKKAAEADLLIKTARATGTELENNALRGLGSENIVGLKMAEVLQGLKVIVLPSGAGGLNPLDLNGTLHQFDVK